MIKTSIVIIGGGVVGCSIAYNLSILGMKDVILLEKDFLASNATGICPGGIRQQWSSEIGCNLAQASVRFFENIEEKLSPNIPLKFVQSGYLFVAHSRKTLATYRKNVALQNSVGIPSKIINIDEIKSIAPDVNLSGIVGGSYCHEDGFLEDCYGFTRTLAAIAKQNGVRIIYDEAKEIILRKDRICGIQGTKEEYECEIVVNTAGCDSDKIAASIGIKLPILSSRRRLLYTQRVEEHFLEPCLAALDKGWAGKQLNEGHIYMAYINTGTENLSDYEFIEKSVELGLEIIPKLAQTQILRIQDGFYDLSPDGNPILGGIEEIEGYYQAVGFSGHGFMISPAIGKVIAQLVVNEKPFVDISSWNMDRFKNTEVFKEDLIL